MLTPEQARQLDAALFEEEDDGAEPPAPPEGVEVADPAIPSRIGHFRIRRMIASGGMGTVYEAEQEHPHRVVALKVLRRGIASRTAMRCFEREVEVLAHLRHPGIAQIYEAGTHDDGTGGVPYFVMELIPSAQPITTYAEEASLTLRQRLEMSTQVCDAVHYGHQKGFIHRDLKPENILVGREPAARDCNGSSEDGTRSTPEVKIIDFGIARATDSDLAVTTIQTDSRALIGTLQYMSPEQCDVGSDDPGAPGTERAPMDAPGHRDLDVRTDVYSLGMVLYELLTGHLAYDVSRKSLPSAARMIQEAEPPHPSTVSRSLRGDVGTIVLKALEKDRTKRYQSVADLCRDIQHYLKGEPIEARPASAWMKSVRWVGRHPVLSTSAVCAAILSLTIGLSMLSVWFLNKRPHELILSDDGRSARLMSVGGHIIHEWTSDYQWGIAFAKWIPSESLGANAGRVVIGRAANAGVDHTLSLCAFDPAGDLETAIPFDYLTDVEIPESVLARGRDARSFGMKHGWVADVFPDDANPGLEIVAVFQNKLWSQCVVRILDAATGQLLYQVWHDGNLIDAIWLDEAKLLVMAGVNGEVPGPKRGFDQVPDMANYPAIVLALQPRLGHISTSILTADSTLEADTLAWYRCLLPKELALRFSMNIVPLHLDDETQNQVRVNVILAGTTQTSFSLPLDRTGHEVPDGRIYTNEWKLASPVPDDNLLQLGDLPAIIPDGILPGESTGSDDR